MKKLMVMASLVLIGVMVRANPVTITLDAGGATFPQFYNDSAAGFVNANLAADGWYVEAILSSSATFNAGLANDLTYFNSFTIVGDGPGTLGTLVNSPIMGSKVDGTQYNTNGKTGIQATFSDTEGSVNGMYFSIRAYNSTSKTLASKYGVLTFQLNDVGPGAGSPFKNLDWTTSATRTYLQYDNPLYAVPEPATLALFGLGGLALVIRKKMRKEA